MFLHHCLKGLAIDQLQEGLIAQFDRQQVFDVLAILSAGVLRPGFATLLNARVAAISPVLPAGLLHHGHDRQFGQWGGKARRTVRRSVHKVEHARGRSSRRQPCTGSKISSWWRVLLEDGDNRTFPPSSTETTCSCSRRTHGGSGRRRPVCRRFPGPSWRPGLRPDRLPPPRLDRWWRPFGPARAPAAIRRAPGNW